MSTTAVPDHSTESLSQLLGRIASDPVQTDQLHRALGKYCHDCRNLLNSIKMSIYLAKRNGTGTAGELWQLVEPRYAEVEQLYTQLHDLCRPVSIAPARLNLDVLFQERFTPWQNRMREVRKTLVLTPPRSPAVGMFDPSRLGVALDGLAAWRGRAGVPGAVVSVSWGVSRERFRLSWDEQAGSPALEAVESLRDRSDLVDVLCVPLLTRVLALHGGTVETHEAASGGWRLDAEWPAEHRAGEVGVPPIGVAGARP